MTAAETERFEWYLDPPTTIERRFAIEIVDFDAASSTVVMSMPVAGMMNPLTGVPTLSPLAILIDDAGGRTNHLLRETHQWTVTSELTLEWGPAEDLFSPADLEQRIVVTARTIGRQGPTATALCTLTSNATTIGYGTLRSYFVPMDGVGAEPPDRSPSSSQPQLSELMALRIQPVDGMRVLMQQPNSAINNRIGTVHGGVAAAGLELAASGVINTGGPHFATASLRVNYLRPFLAGEQSRYVATPLRVGRTSAIADAHAIGDDGRTAIVARMTAYR
jgi:uncharacterized protein (TIGR00369 family)